MGILALAADERVADVRVAEDELSVRLMDGRTISVPLVWYPRLMNATEAQRKNWRIVGGGYGIHWDEIDEDLSTEGLLRGAPAPRQGVAKIQLPPKHVEGALNNKPKDDEQLVVEISEDESEKGFLDHLTEGEEAAQELTNIISVIDKETRNIAAKFEQHTSNINRLSSVPGGVKASDFRKIALLSASDMNTFSKRIEDVLPKFEQNTQTLEESFSAYVSFASPDSNETVEQISNLRNSLSEMLIVFRPVKESVMKFRDSTLSIGQQKLSKELNKATNRQSKVLDGVISNIEQVESFALKIIFLIDEKFREPPSSEDEPK